MSSYVIAAPEALALASGDLAGIREAIEKAAAAAAPSTTGISAAAADEVSAAIATFFGSYADELQTLTARTTTQIQSAFEQAVSAAGAAYAAAEAANAAPLQQLGSVFSPLSTCPLFNGTGAATVGALLNFATNSVGLGKYINFPSTLPVTGTNGVTGVRVGFSFLQIPIGPTSFLGFPIPQFNYPAPAFWYFPTQANGSVAPNGTVYFSHGFGAFGWLYQPLAIELAGQTNSVVVTPTVPSIPLPLGLWIGSPEMQQGVASLFQGPQTALNLSAQRAGFFGTLPQDFILSGHSAGGGLTSIAAGNYLANLGGGTNHLKGVVMFDGVANNNAAFAGAITQLKAASVPIYTVAAPPQAWNAFGNTTNQLVSLYPGQFVGAEIAGGSHVDSMLGRGPLIDLALQVITQFSPPGATAAVYTLSTGWINDMWAGATPAAPQYGIYGLGPNNSYQTGGQAIVLGPATAIILPV
ncbi:PE domain-containing protein [Mycobacterium gordonae]|uniref:PE-PGRS family protein n=1 Tax=Mycobacterium gordonae TaxID=1778 RepID=A0A1X1XBW3_MYCGO|nr:PE family protein [Mycobacterium gordonae]MCV7009866.1 PE family protein [Mycobacterium gordonae]ODR18185.1 PE-PGRS family protein [Mycobacterium gordonae]ORV96168.1 PE-PGRS family protein [Mycobacterium gordonae]